MKNITQYFDDSVKSVNGATSCANNETMREEYSHDKKGSRGKRSRVKIRISRSSTSERICDIVENSNDMIDKTPSPFSKENGKNENQRDTPKRSSTLKSILATRNKTLTDNGQNINHKGSNNFNGSSDSDNSSNDGNSNDKKKQKKRFSEDCPKVCSETDKRLKKELIDKLDVSRDSRTSGNSKVKDKKMIDDDTMELINVDPNDEGESGKDECSSNAFAILMGHNKPVAQCPAAQTKFSPPDAKADAKRSEECREKLKRTKERLEALADKRGRSKRKVAEMEESEKIEEMIKDRLKLFKGEKKKDNGAITTNLSQKQSAGTLLNYFSKAPVDLNTAGVTTVVVKADVHATQSDDQSQSRPTKRSIKIKQIRRSRRIRRNKGSDFDLSRVDDIRIVESDNVDVLGNEGGKRDRRQTKRVSSSSSSSSDEEIFTARRTGTELNMENRKKCGTSKSVDLKTSPTTKGKKTEKTVSKQANGATTKLRKKKGGEPTESKQQELVKGDEYQSRPMELIVLAENNDTQSQQNGQQWPVRENDRRRKAAKLAPLFAKRKKPDPEAMAARRLFLRPNTTDTCTKGTNRKMGSVYGTLSSFPLISHVTQLSSRSAVFDGCKIPNEIPKVPAKHVPLIDSSNFKDVIDWSNGRSSSSSSSKSKSKSKSKSVEKLARPPRVSDVLAELGRNCSNVKEIWDVISVIKGGSNKTIKYPKSSLTGKRRKQSETKEKIESIDEEQLEYCSWTYKYRPRRSGQVIGNDEAVRKLKDWLIGWSAISAATNGDSGDEFYQSDNSRSTSIESNQVAVLLGPHGCGKTASVYAIAEEFGYTVLELNASSRRTGKKLSKEFEEATKSHRIKNNNGKAAAVAAVAPPTALYYDTNLDEIESKDVPQNSLILLEDVDLIFEEDEGFVSAAYQLASNSKRPIVMTCRDVCPHLSKMAPQQTKIHFQRPSGNAVSVLLELISMVETGYRLPSDRKIDLLQTGDLRRSLLQLQYLLLSGPLKILDRSVNLKNSFWHSVLCNVYKPAIKVSKRSKKRSKASSNEKINDKSILIDLASKLDDIALMSSLTDVQDTALDLSEIKIQPNLSLIEDTSTYSSSSDVCLEISEWIGNKVMRTGQFSDSELQLHNNIVLRKQINKNVDLVLARATTFVLDRRILAMDYLPSVRAICRAEKSRATANSKRGNRFFHYLHNLKVAAAMAATTTTTTTTTMTAASVFKPNILTAACDMMHDAIRDDSETSRS
ncbi:ATPase family AAA domain-containing protein 5 isoform X2 [Ceratina calcarata]|uniref:ATPase family AAA domain-containing protein 5 isoform X2 n=1 Tax=Ceratina calcarata TaxID=156304 RepID=A0AAJ7JDB3_9HYME|nr:ATPase family AAA domain-containing protein 5 isoform X2 [Ceratina calcarata]